MGSTPFLGGGFGHFYAYVPTKIEYAIDRYAMEVKRQLDVLDQRLAQSTYLAGDEYTIADMAVWPWYGVLTMGEIYGAGEFLQVQTYTNVVRWTNLIAQRPAARRGRMVNRTSGDPAGQLVRSCAHPHRFDAANSSFAPPLAGVHGLISGLNELLQGLGKLP
jgi:GSH-dependent disulfide-bond oxidoreductase